jgi:hypothetical protein
MFESCRDRQLTRVSRPPIGARFRFGSFLALACDRSDLIVTYAAFGTYNTSDAHFKDVKPELTGIGGWLGLLAFGQVTGILRLLVSLGQYYTMLDPQVTAKFPTAIWGEAAMNALVIWLCVYTAVLFFRHSRNFPRCFIWQMIAVICMPIVDLLWVAFMISLASGRPFTEFLTLEAKEGGQIIAAVIGALIWIPYILRSRRVANTFTV